MILSTLAKARAPNITHFFVVYPLLITGIPAVMLPAPSAEDCLVADLGIDPSYPGLQTLEATDFLLRGRTLLTDMHVILWQVGCVGDVGFARKGYKNDNFPILIAKLQKLYGTDYIITHYIGAQYPVCDATIDQISLSEILLPENRKKITGLSTLYIPPSNYGEVDPDMAVQLGMVTTKEAAANFLTGKRCINQYGPREKAALQELEDWGVPLMSEYPRSSQLSHVLMEASVSPSFSEKLKNTQLGRIKLDDPFEDAVLRSGHPGRIRMALKATPSKMTDKAMMAFITQPKLAKEFRDFIKAQSKNLDGEDKVNEWLKDHGYDTTVDDITQAAQDLRENSLLPWTRAYQTNLQKTLQIRGIFILIHELEKDII